MDVCRNIDQDVLAFVLAVVQNQGVAKLDLLVLCLRRDLGLEDRGDGNKAGAGKNLVVDKFW